MGSIKEKGYNCTPALRTLSKKLISARRFENAIHLLELLIKSNSMDAESISLLDLCRKTMDTTEWDGIV